MNTWVEAPPPKQGMGCFGKGCLLFLALVFLLAAAFIVGSYVGVRYVITSSKPRELPVVAPDPQVQQDARARWDQFEQASRGEPSGATQPNGVDQSTTAAQASRVEFTANDINQLIAANRKARGKAYVSIENNVARVQVSIPLEKVGFRGRYLNGEAEVRASPDRNPRGLQLTKISLSGVDVPEQVVNSLTGGRSLVSYIDQYSQEYQITSFAIEDNKVILESNGQLR